jgi:hypothetical protein
LVIDMLSDRCERVLAESQEYARRSSASPSWMCSPRSRKMTPYRRKLSTPVVLSSQMCHLKVWKPVLNLLHHSECQKPSARIEKALFDFFPKCFQLPYDSFFLKDDFHNHLRN